MKQAVCKSDVERQCVKTTAFSPGHNHSALIRPNCQLNVPRHCISGGHAAQRHFDVGLSSSDCFQPYAAVSLMGNRLPDCAVAGVSAANEHQHQQGLRDTRTYRDCSQWSPAQNNSAVLQHSWSSGQQLPPSCDVSRSVWASLRSPAALNGIDSHHNYAANVQSRAPQIYAHQACSQMPNRFPPANMPAARFCAVNIPAVNVQQNLMWMKVRSPQQQQIARDACRNNIVMTPVQNVSLVCAGQSNTSSPDVWQSRFASQSFSSGRLSVRPRTDAASTSQSEHNMTTMSAAESCRVNDVSRSPAAANVSDSSTMRNNTVGRIYQLPVQTVAVTSVHSQHETCVQSPVSTCSSSPATVSSSASVMTTAESVVNVKPVTKAVITPIPTPSQPEPYVAGRRYTVTKKDGVTVEGIWDGKYLTVLPTTSATSTTAQTPGNILCFCAVCLRSFKI